MGAASEGIIAANVIKLCCAQQLSHVDNSKFETYYSPYIYSDITEMTQKKEKEQKEAHPVRVIFSLTGAEQ